MSMHWTSDGSTTRVGACPDFLGEDTGWDVKFPVQGHMANTGPQGPGTTWSQGSPAGLSRGGRLGWSPGEAILPPGGPGTGERGQGEEEQQHDSKF